MSLESLEPPHPTMAAYRLAFEAALRGRPERAARLATLEQACGHAETEAEFRAHSLKIAALIREVEDELAPDWPQVWYSGKDQPAESGQSAAPARGVPRGLVAPSGGESG